MQEISPPIIGASGTGIWVGTNYNSETLSYTPESETKWILTSKKKVLFSFLKANLWSLEVSKILKAKAALSMYPHFRNSASRLTAIGI